MSTTPHDPDLEREIERTRTEAARLASGAAESVKERGKETLDHTKERAADRADELASALESTAADLESSDDAMAGYGRSMAELMRRFAGGLREHEIEEFAGQLAGFARRNPASFLAGSVALGFGVSRFLKATSARAVDEYEDDFDDEEAWLEGDDADLDETLYAAETGPYEPDTSTPRTESAGWPEDAGHELSSGAPSPEHRPPDAPPPGMEAIDPHDSGSRRSET